jgi:hypothetical protein
MYELTLTVKTLKPKRQLTVYCFRTSSPDVVWAKAVDVAPDKAGLDRILRGTRCWRSQLGKYRKLFSEKQRRRVFARKQHG